MSSSVKAQVANASIYHKSEVLQAWKWEGNIFTGEWSKAGGGSYSVIEPASGDSLFEAGMANIQDVADAAVRAKQVRKSWTNVSPRDKHGIFTKAARFLEDNITEIAELIFRETGGTRLKGMHEVREGIQILHIAAGMCLEPQGYVIPSSSGRQSYAKRVPLGVVGVISPFNFPLVLSLRAAAPALAAGNTVILKPDAQTVFSGAIAAALALEAGGLPKGVLQIMPGEGDVGAALCSAPEVDMIAFTGSTATGRKVAETASKHLKKVSLELGGKSPLIILEDADIDVATSNAAWGCFLHQGQICMASGRVFVHERIYDAFTKKLVERANKLTVGNPMEINADIGPIINQVQLDRVNSIVQDSISAGAKLETGGTYKKLFYKPTVLSNVKPGMRSYHEEVFGPVANLIAFKSDEEVIQMANDTEYGLSAGIISKDIARAQRIGEEIHSGALHINDQTINDDCVNPFGGCGVSGNGGNIGGPSNWESFSQLRWITIQGSAHPYPF